MEVSLRRGRLRTILKQGTRGDSGKFTTEPDAKVDQPGALSSLDTPFFYFDLQSAVRAAELGAVASDSKIDKRSTRSYDKEFGPSNDL